MAAVCLGPKYTTHCEHVNLRWSRDRLHRVPGYNGLVLVDIWLPMFANARTRAIMRAHSHGPTGIGQRVGLAQSSVPKVLLHRGVRAVLSTADGSGAARLSSDRAVWPPFCASAVIE